jgi:hypothetical protein
MFTRIVVACAAVALLTPSLAAAKTDQSNWPTINGLLLMNKQDGERPLDARWGRDPHSGQDRSYSWDQIAKAIWSQE